jgi:Peptidase family M28
LGRRWLVGAAAALLLSTGCGGGSSGKNWQPANAFDAARAWQLVKRQVAVGQRPAGSPRLRKLAARLRLLLPAGRFEAIPGEPGLRNVVGVLPGIRPAIVVGAHYDTLASPPGFVGANNGAAGTAVVIEAARALMRTPAARGAHEVRFVLFDGEEPPAGLPEEGQDFYAEGLRGSRAYVAAHRGETADMVLLDYVGNRGLELPREGTSSEALWSRVLIAAETVGYERYFSDRTGPAITDDHTPFLREGVPEVDLIDWSYPGHSLADRLERISPAAMDGVGETVVRLVNELRNE